MVLLTRNSPRSHRPRSHPSQHPPAAVAAALAAAAAAGIAGVFLGDGTSRIIKTLMATTPQHLTVQVVAETIIGQGIGGS